ncbi:hypothetical protein L228DRAFT_141356 [Xylona heveae TC161]|uniref:Uncharacterized protein n=1 Tax=Xylona heveae (strain CBS 132557 / TC161) TaxID=1328760 RepID=A0A165H5D8_XYLHT|nr:hypothetical protein L228DRAFT_141356 [Xylona heveae TC161]KZF23008.1 hypothetical protein L228DRAFT_141356 [Xylona heveae TC161]
MNLPTKNRGLINGQALNLNKGLICMKRLSASNMSMMNVPMVSDMGKQEDLPTYRCPWTSLTTRRLRHHPAAVLRQHLRQPMNVNQLEPNSTAFSLHSMGDAPHAHSSHFFLCIWFSRGRPVVILKSLRGYIISTTAYNIPGFYAPLVTLVIVLLFPALKPHCVHYISTSLITLLVRPFDSLFISLRFQFRSAWTALESCESVLPRQAPKLGSPITIVGDRNASSTHAQPPPADDDGVSLDFYSLHYHRPTTPASLSLFLSASFSPCRETLGPCRRWAL